MSSLGHLISDTISRQCLRAHAALTEFAENLFVVLAECGRRRINLGAAVSEGKSRQRDAEAALDNKAYAKYPKLTESEIQTLVVDDKWLAALNTAIHGEMDRLSLDVTPGSTQCLGSPTKAAL